MNMLHASEPWQSRPSCVRCLSSASSVAPLEESKEYWCDSSLPEAGQEPPLRRRPVLGEREAQLASELPPAAELALLRGLGAQQPVPGVLAESARAPEEVLRWKARRVFAISTAPEQRPQRAVVAEWR
jgi:hypothetical protein